MKRNQTVRLYARDRGVCLWELAEALGISEATMTRLLRTPLEADREKEILEAIDRIAEREGK